jgi:hypothetical protein
MRTSTPHFQRRQRHRHSGRTANENLPYFLEIEFPTLPQCLAINHCLPASDQPSLKPISMQRSARRMILLLVGVFACLSTVLGPSESLARSPGRTVVRGRLVGHGAFGPNTPVGGMKLTLYNNRFGRSSLWCREVMSGLPLEISLQVVTLLKYGFRTDLTREHSHSGRIERRSPIWARLDSGNRQSPPVETIT